MKSVGLGLVGNPNFLLGGGVRLQAYRLPIHRPGVLWSFHFDFESDHFDFKLDSFEFDDFDFELDNFYFELDNFELLP